MKMPVRNQNVASAGTLSLMRIHKINETSQYFNLCFIYEKNCKLSYNESPNEIDLHIVLCIKYIILLDARSNHIRTI